jgi:hypothetical protein
MGRSTRLAFRAGLLFSLLAAMNVVAAGGDGSGTASRLSFSGDLDGALAQSLVDGRPLFVMFVAAWCPICSKMKQEALTDPSVTAHAGAMRWVMVDIDRQLTTARAWGVEAVPSIVFVNAAGEPQERLIGGLTAQELQLAVERFLSGSAPPDEPERPGAADQERPHSDLIWSPKGYRGAGICFSHVGYGPLNLYSQSPFQSLRLGIRPRTPSTLGRGDREFRATATWVNTWANGDDYFLDFESLQTALAFGYGITDTLQIEAEVQQRDRFGGVMDPFVQGFHDLFGIDQGGRDEVTHGEFSFDLDAPGGPSVSLTSADRGTFSRGVQVALQHNVTCGTARAPAFSYSLTSRLETLDSGDLSGASDVDVGLSVALARRVKHFYFYGTLGYAWFGSDRFRGIPIEDSQWTILAAAEWRFRADQSFLLQYLVTEGLVPGFGPFADDSHEITVGWKWEVVSKTLVEVGLIENLISFDNSPDFGLHAGVVRRF